MFFFIPLGTTRPRWRFPYVTYGLIGANFLVFLLQIGLEDAMPPGFIPNRPSPFTWLLSIFMHAGILHLAGNMVFLWLFATLTEDVFGPWLLLIFYFAADIGATALHVLIATIYTPASLSVPVVGASGAIAGIMGLSAVCFLRTKVRVWYLVGLYLYWRMGIAEVAAPLFVGLWAGWELVKGLAMTSMEATYGGTGGVAHWAHIGGFAVGLGGALALKLRGRVVYTDLVEGRRPVTSSFQAFAQAGELEQMVERSPNNADAWHALGRARESSGRLAKAGEAHARALVLFLKERRPKEAAEAYQAMKEYQAVPALPDDLLFLLACALEEGGRKKDAFVVFRRLTLTSPQGPRTETALIRAAEIARVLPDCSAHAEECYRALLQDFPYSPWRGLAMQGLRELGATSGDEQAAPDDGERPGGTPDDDLRRLRERGKRPSRFDYLDLRRETDRDESGE